ncbi:MAG: hypothetical protein E6Y25_05895 [Sneathia sanguinegens]|uniref:hypothetical protein n=1 Tax=Sneathia sanguinegens TaxID=40543 RepID=UPI00290FA496|nr:hypothetical protein [Sneathia sanguinegens]MDU4652943.1 hypothetical protein [Sneathia sanguinegens]
MILAKDYMKEQGIKSKQTLYNLQEKGKIKLVKKDNRNYVVDLENELDVELAQEEFDIRVNDLEIKNNVLQDQIKELENKIYKLELDLKNKDKEIELREYQVKGLENQINMLKEENHNKQTMIMGLQQQMSEINQSNILLLETRKEQQKKWYQVWKK